MWQKEKLKKVLVACTFYALIIRSFWFMKLYFKIKEKIHIEAVVNWFWGRGVWEVILPWERGFSLGESYAMKLCHLRSNVNLIRSIEDFQYTFSFSWSKSIMKYSNLYLRKKLHDCISDNTDVNKIQFHIFF